MPTRHRVAALLASTTAAAAAVTLVTVGTVGSSSAREEAPARPGAVLVATGSSDNNGSSSCRGVQNASCTGRLVVEAVGVGTAPLFPGAQVSVPFRVRNPNNFSVVVSSAQITRFALSGAAAGCSVPRDLTVPTTARRLSSEIAPGASAPMRTDAVRMSVDVADGCKGRTFDVTVTATAMKR